jgi:iron-sulfur cluster assembly protein
MIEVGAEGIKKMKQFLEEQEEPRPIRILTTEGGWRGPYLVLSSDGEKETDAVFAQDGITFVIDKKLLEKAKYVKIDYVHSALGSGYTLKSDLLKDLVGGCEAPLCQTCAPHG